MTAPSCMNWRRCKDIPHGIEVYDQPVVLNRKLFARGGNSRYETVVQYTPDLDQGDLLPPAPVGSFTVTTLDGQLLVVGGLGKSTGKTVNKIFKFDELLKQWVTVDCELPSALKQPVVVQYNTCLIVAGGAKTFSKYTTEVNVWDKSKNKWFSAKPLPSPDSYKSVLIRDTMCLVGQKTRDIFQAHLPTLLAATETGVWKLCSKTPYYWSSPVTIDNTLLTVGGSDELYSRSDRTTTCINMYDPTRNQWTRVGDLPQPMKCCNCTVLSGELFVLGGLDSYSVCVASVTLST